MEKKEKSISKKQKEYIRTEEQEDGFVEIRCRMKEEQAVLLRKILFESDLSNSEQMEKDVFQFGRILKAKDYLSRKLFVCMVSFMNYGRS